MSLGKNMVSTLVISMGSKHTYTSSSAFSAMFKRHLGYSPQNFK